VSVTPLKLAPSQRPDIGFRPKILEPMLAAADAGRDLVPPLRKILASLGFQSFMYGFTTTTSPTRESQLYFFATAPREWSLHYEKENYIEIDPRITIAVKHTAPVPWDYATALEKAAPKHRARVERFLNDASRYGIRSGVSWVLRTPEHDGVLIALNASERVFGPSEQARFSRNLGAIFTFGTYFHEFFMRNFVDGGIPSRLRGAALTERELEILGLVARGLTAEDIALKLDIVERTVRFHVDSARTKIGALNREEAIAIVAKAGLLNIVR
jgi:DNA-binding CsgD family transcriptional regulator